MAKIKSTKEIEIMKRGGKILAAALKSAVDAVRPGITVKELDMIAEKKMRELGATPTFLGYKQAPDQDGFPSTMCVSINEEVIHGLGNRARTLVDGDVVGLDIGCWFEGMATDMAVTVAVGAVSDEDRLLIERTYESLRAGLKAIKDGATIRSLGKAVQDSISPYKYGIVRDYVGHGVGHKPHEDPSVPNYDEPSVRGKFEQGMTVAIEPMIIMGGDSRIEHLDDGWTVVSHDGSRAAHFEVTVAVTKDGYELVTPFVV